jgi:hypothetical protein
LKRNSFDAKETHKQDILWDVMAEWAASLIGNRIAHVVVTSDNSQATKPLTKGASADSAMLVKYLPGSRSLAMPTKQLNMIHLTDASAQVRTQKLPRAENFPDIALRSQSALQYVSSKLEEVGKANLVNDKTSEAISILGGRLTDLETLVQKVRSGLEIPEAVDDIVNRSQTEIRKSIFGDDSEDRKDSPWTQAEAWYLVKTLSKEDDVGAFQYPFSAIFLLFSRLNAERGKLLTGRLR